MYLQSHSVPNARSRVHPCALLIALCLFLVGQTVAAQTGPRPEDFMALQQEYLALQQRLVQAQQSTIENHPALQQQIMAMEDLVTDRMRARGFDPGNIMESLLALQGQLRDERLTPEQRQRIFESSEFQTAQAQLQAAQAAVVDDPDIIAAQQALDEAILQALRRVEPDLDRILERLQVIQQQMISMQPPR